MITVFSVDAALEQVCAIFREHADRGDINPAERDLLIDGAILLAMHVDDQTEDGRESLDSGRSQEPLPKPAGKHERRPAAMRQRGHTIRGMLTSRPLPPVQNKPSSMATGRLDSKCPPAN